MEKLKNIIENSEALAKGLRSNGERHLYYKQYTSMERALALIVSGCMYLSNGKSWNDVRDRDIMRQKRVYGTCFSCSTKENVAMWMLYSADKGKQGAMLNFPRAVMKEILSLQSIELGKFDSKTQQFISAETLHKENGDYEIFLTDVVYTDYSSDKKLTLTVAEDHEPAEKSVLEHDDIFHKNYAWAYEKETRLVVRLSEKWHAYAEGNELSTIQIRLSNSSINKMKDKRLVRSPIYRGGVSYGELSELNGDVDWNI